MQKLQNNIKMEIVRHQKRRTERRPHVSHAMSTCQPLTLLKEHLQVCTVTLIGVYCNTYTSKRTLTGVYCNTHGCVL